MWGKTKKFIENNAMQEYIRCFSKKNAIHASCEDYRAAATIDILHHKLDKGKKIDCPILVLWGKHSTIQKLYNPLKIWRKWAKNVSGFSLNCGHFLAEESPKELYEAVQGFFRK